ncbi:MAG TPA: hypothetical protein VGG64_17185 [Pirellulales bacterium]|jgi:hypothetical protein
MATAEITFAQTLRIVTYNIDADTNGAAGADAGPGLTTVLQAIGSESLNGHAQPIDVLALEELYGTPSTTLSYIVGQLNGIYGTGTYAYDTTTDPTDGNFLTGNGPSGLIYNTKTVQDLGAVAVGTASSSGAARAPMRYELQPIGSSSAADFYMYVSHAKSGTTSSDATRRNIEATEVRADAATLGPNAHIIYSGDWNIDHSGEATYQTLTASGVGQANDPANPAGNWTSSASFAGILTESATSLKYRDDLQLVSGPMLNQSGMQLVSGMYTAFGNNGTTKYGGSTSAVGNTALSDLSNRVAVLSALTTATDHLPVVADYAVVGLTPPHIPGDANQDGVVNGLDINLVASNWAEMGSGLPGDVNGDSVVNGLDINLIATNWVQTTGTGAVVVPEPCGIVLMILGLGLMACRQGRRLTPR